MMNLSLPVLAATLIITVIYYDEPSFLDRGRFNQPGYNRFPHHDDAYSLPLPQDGHLEDDAIDNENPLHQEESRFGSSAGVR
jgi:hypothetical protein